MLDSSAISIVALIVSLFSVITSTYFAVTSNRRAKKNLSIDYQFKIQEWVSKVIETKSDAFVLSEYSDDGDFERQRIEVLAKLTSLLDQGRMFFPNIDADWGSEKPVAYQGLRHEILDPIKASFDLVKGMKGLNELQRGATSETFLKFRREFVSIAHDELSPKDRDQFFKRLDGSKRRFEKNKI